MNELIADGRFYDRLYPKRQLAAEYNITISALEELKTSLICDDPGLFRKSIRQMGKQYGVSDGKVLRCRELNADKDPGYIRPQALIKLATAGLKAWRRPEGIQEHLDALADN